jgi:hypothetical protein
MLAAAGQRGELALGPELLRRLPPRVTWILGTEIAAARLGQLQGDPGRGMRRLHRAIGSGR